MEPKATATEQLQAAKLVAAQKLETFKAEASQHLNTAAAQLDELKDQLVTKARQAGKDVDIDGLTAQASVHFENAKATAAETLSTLQAQAEVAYAAAAVKVDELADIADDKLDDFRADAAVHLDAAQVKLEEVKAEAALQIEAAKERAKAVWNSLFGH